MRCTLFVLGMALSTVALAHDNPDNWIGKNRYLNKSGASCCNENDCKVVSAESVKMTPRGYHLSDGNFINYHDARISEDKHYWRCDWGYPVKLQCFFAPTGGV